MYIQENISCGWNDLDEFFGIWENEGEEGLKKWRNDRREVNFKNMLMYLILSLF